MLHTDLFKHLNSDHSMLKHRRAKGLVLKAERAEKQENRIVYKHEDVKMVLYIST